MTPRGERVVTRVIFMVVALPFLIPLLMLVLLCAALIDVTVGAGLELFAPESLHESWHAFTEPLRQFLRRLDTGRWK